MRNKSCGAGSRSQLASGEARRNDVACRISFAAPSIMQRTTTPRLPLSREKKEIHIQDLQQRVVVERREVEREQKDQDRDDAQDDSTGVETTLKRYFGVAHHRQEQQQAPEYPADPGQQASNQQQQGQNPRQEPVELWREGIDHVTAIQLAAGDQIQRSHEEANPASQQHGMRSHLLECGEVWIPMHEER